MSERLITEEEEDVQVFDKAPDDVPAHVAEVQDRLEEVHA